MSELVGTGIGIEHLASKEFSGDQLALGAVPPAMTVVSNFNLASYTINDDSVIQMRVPKTWYPNARNGLRVNIQWACPNAYVNQDVNWQIDWEAVPLNGAEAIGAATHTGTAATGDINVPLVADAPQENLLDEILPAELSPGDMIGITITRIAVAGVDPANEPYILGVTVDLTQKFPSYDQ
jgi:hypothetical protein